MSWTQETIEELTRLWDAGFSTSEIGKRIGVSKNAVVGKAHRLGLISRPSPIKRTAPPPPVISAAPKTYAQPGGRTCSWPIGDPRKPGFAFCSEHALPGKPYCAQHAQMAYVAPKNRSHANEDAA
jgi:GcrA cell cycle regulator